MTRINRNLRDLEIVGAADAGLDLVQLGARFRLPYAEIERALERGLKARANDWAARPAAAADRRGGFQTRP